APNPDRKALTAIASLVAGGEWVHHVNALTAPACKSWKRSTAGPNGPTRHARRVLHVHHRPTARNLGLAKAMRGRWCGTAPSTHLALHQWTWEVGRFRPVNRRRVLSQLMASSSCRRMRSTGSALGTDVCSMAQSATVTCRRIGSHTAALVPEPASHWGCCLGSSPCESRMTWFGYASEFHSATMCPF